MLKMYRVTGTFTVDVYADDETQAALLARKGEAGDYPLQLVDISSITHVKTTENCFQCCDRDDDCPQHRYQTKDCPFCRGTTRLAKGTQSQDPITREWNTLAEDKAWENL